MYRVLALDPGGTTGWATYTAKRIPVGGLITEGPAEYEYYDEKWACGQIGPDEHHYKLDRFLGHMHTQEFIVVCESFEFRNLDRRDRDNLNLMSREYIGVVKQWHQALEPEGYDTSGVKLVFQTAAQAKGFIPDKGPQANKKIKDAGLWYPNQKHAMDATRHLLWYLVNRENRMDLVTRWWKPSAG
jgi:hypothetical protein